MKIIELNHNYLTLFIIQIYIYVLLIILKWLSLKFYHVFISSLGTYFSENLQTLNRFYQKHNASAVNPLTVLHNTDTGGTFLAPNQRLSLSSRDTLKIFFHLRFQLQGNNFFVKIQGIVFKQLHFLQVHSLREPFTFIYGMFTI